MRDEGLNQAANALEERISSCTVGIPTHDERRNPVIGTGSAIIWAGTPFILTAAHVVKDLNLGQVFIFVRPPGNIERTYLSDRVPGTRFLPKVQIQIKRKLVLDPHDIALLEIANGEVPFQGLIFEEIRMPVRSPVIGTSVHIQGFPARMSEQVTENSFAANRVIAYQEIVDPPEMSNFSPELHFATNYTFGDELGPGAIDPHGLSGAGAWYQAPKDSIIWSAEPRLAGVMTHFRTQRRLLTGVRVEVVADALARALRDEESDSN